MSVHYKFKSAISYDTITFDGLHISVRDLKKAILHQKQIGKNTDFDLQVTNAQTNEGNDNTIILCMHGINMVELIGIANKCVYAYISTFVLIKSLYDL